MQFTLTNLDIQNSLWNNVHGVGHLFVGGAISVSINKIAHHLFGIEQKTVSSYAVKAGAFAAGVGASLYLSQRFSLVSTISGKIAYELLIIDCITLVASKILGNNFCAGLSSGAVLGWLGYRGLVPLGALGAGIGAII